MGIDEKLEEKDREHRDRHKLTQATSKSPTERKESWNSLPAPFSGRQVWYMSSQSQSQGVQVCSGHSRPLEV